MGIRTEFVLQRLKNQVSEPDRGGVVLQKADAQLILERINALEEMGAQLLRSAHEQNSKRWDEESYL